MIDEKLVTVVGKGMSRRARLLIDWQKVADKLAGKADANFSGRAVVAGGGVRLIIEPLKPKA